MPYLFALLVSVLTAQVPQSSTGTAAWNLGVRLSADVPGKITALRFYKWAGDAGPHDGHVWTMSGDKLAGVTFVNETPSGWQEQALSQPLPVAANTDLVVSVGHPAGSNFPILPMGEVETSYYLRMRVVDKPGVLADLTRILADASISIDAMVQKEPAEGESKVDIVLLTHRAVEKNVDSAIRKIEKLRSVVGKVTRIRLEELL